MHWHIVTKRIQNFMKASAVTYFLRKKLTYFMTRRWLEADFYDSKIAYLLSVDRYVIAFHQKYNARELRIANSTNIHTVC